MLAHQSQMEGPHFRMVLQSIPTIFVLKRVHLIKAQFHLSREGEVKSIETQKTKE